MRAPRVFGRQAVERRVRHRMECREVRAAQVDLAHEPVGRGHDLAVAFAGRADDELSNHAALLQSACAALAVHLVRPIERRQDFVEQVFLRREPLQAHRIGRFQVDGDAVGILHQLFDAGAVGAGHELDVQIAGELMLLAQQLANGDQAIHGPGAAAVDARREKQAIHQSPGVHLHKSLCHFFRCKLDARQVAPAPPGAVEAVASAVRGQQRLEHRHALAVAADDGADGTLQRTRLLCNAAGRHKAGAGALGRRIDLEASVVAEQF